MPEHAPPNPSRVPPPDRGHLLTEQRNQRSANLDSLSTLECLRVINDEDRTVADAVGARLTEIAAFTDLVIAALGGGGRLVYLGAGTSGRLGVLDASECPPTFQTDPGQIVGLIAGGDAALRRSSERMEDDRDGAHAELSELGVGPRDAVLGIAAGGTTPYVLGGVEFAKSRGAKTGLLTCTPMEKPGWCDVLMAIETGPEVITGSTRMKAGTATKMALNMITTGAMVGLGKTYSNMMVDLRATNDKLRDRAGRIIAELTGLDREEALAMLDAADNSVRHAVVMARLGVDRPRADELLKDAGGHLSRVLGEKP